MTPQEHYDDAERLLGGVDRGLEFLSGKYATLTEALLTLIVGAMNAQTSATLALAGFTRDAATGADHVHDVVTVEPGTAAASSWATEPGRPA